MTRNVAKSAKNPEEFRFFQPPANALKALAVVPLTPQGRSRTTSHSLVREYLIRTGVEGDRTMVGLRPRQRKSLLVRVNAEIGASSLR